MAKVGIDSFLLDCRTNDNISEIEAEYGVKGFAVIVRLWQKIYSEKGYYCEWVERSPLLFLANWFGGNSGVTINLINDIVTRCLKNGIFNAEMYEEHSILTSARIQKQYFDVVKRREEIPVKKEYLLISVDKINGIVYENAVSVCRNQENVCKSGTSKGKESKENKSKVNHNMRAIDHVACFDFFWRCYPLDKNRCSAERAYTAVLTATDYTEDDLVESAKNYAEYCRITGTNEEYMFHANNFLSKAHFEDYLPGRYKKPAQQKSGNRFHDFEQNHYDFEELEKELTTNL